MNSGRIEPQDGIILDDILAFDEIDELLLSFMDEMAEFQAFKSCFFSFYFEHIICVLMTSSRDVLYRYLHYIILSEQKVFYPSHKIKDFPIFSRNLFFLDFIALSDSKSK